jgi:hypothetical protein
LLIWSAAREGGAPDKQSSIKEHSAMPDGSLFFLDPEFWQEAAKGGQNQSFFGAILSLSAEIEHTETEGTMHS